MLGFMKRSTIDFSNLKVFKLIYYSLVRSYLEFSSCIWSPYYEIHKHSLESVQHKFLRFLAFKFDVPFDKFNCDYRALESKFEIAPLELRRIYFDLKLLYKCLNSMIDCPELVELFTRNF